MNLSILCQRGSIRMKKSRIPLNNDEWNPIIRRVGY